MSQIGFDRSNGAKLFPICVFGERLANPVDFNWIAQLGPGAVGFNIGDGCGSIPASCQAASRSLQPGLDIGAVIPIESRLIDGCTFDYSIDGHGLQLP